MSATTVLDKAGKQEIFVFVSTSLSANGFVYVFNGSGWWWQYIGTIPKHSWTAPAAVSYLDQAGTTRVYAFPQVSSNTLSEKYLDSAGWHTASLFSPMYTASDPSAVTFKEVQSAIPFIYVFYLGHDGPGDGHLYMLSSSPFGWQWSDQGTM